ncbi:MAG: EAL domain-containing protein [Anaerolineae bacterium]|nr:EAL domain-containing protein [Anaerolineae bacterium]
MKTMRAGRTTPQIVNAIALPDEVADDRSALISRGIQTLALFPLYDGNRLTGSIRVDNPDSTLNLPPVQFELVQVAGQLAVRMVRAERDLSEQMRRSNRLAYQNSHDQQTGLPNQQLFLDSARSIFAKGRRPFAILLVDLDYYPLLSDRLAEESTDLVQQVVTNLHTCVRADDMIARLGEDRFGILLKDVEETSFVETVAQRILERLRHPFTHDGRAVTITTVVGAALRNGHQQNAELVLQEACIAVIQARQNCPGRFLMFDYSMRDQLLQRMEMESELRTSLEHAQLLLHYQPISELKTGRLIGFEALVRWQHPQRGLIWPNEFIQLSEETGLIIPLGLWVLREACRQMRLWQDHFPIDPPLMISVNISPRQLNPDFYRQVANILAETSLPPTCLRLEMTESSIVRSDCEMVQALDNLRRLGVQLYIDDFGTGYSSLGYLDSLPVDAIKIDRSFVNNLGRAKSTTGVVQAIITLAHELDIDVVAEGVETFEQHSVLKHLNCEFMQGFFISEPLDIPGVERYIAGLAGC